MNHYITEYNEKSQTSDTYDSKIKMFKLIALGDLNPRINISHHKSHRVCVLCVCVFVWK